MKILIVGGSGGGKPSGVVAKISAILDAHSFEPVTTWNDGTLPNSVNGQEVILWMPDINNEHEKTYPVKDKGAVLICSKVMREGYTRLDAVERIFKMHGNAVIAIYKDKKGLFKFELIDALGNIWCSTYVIKNLCFHIKELTEWTQGSIRKGMKQSPYTNIPPFSLKTENELKTFVEVNKKLAYKVANQCGNRFFGNYSTRCTKLFPTLRKDDAILVSPRNIDKRTITVDDMVLVHGDKYIGERKPSVDTPVQLQLYKEVDSINFMIHGHAFVIGYTSNSAQPPFTDNSYPCGDMREVKETSALLRDGHRVINLLNHGFLITARTIGGLKLLADKCTFRKIQSF